MTNKLKATRKLSDISFEAEGSHMALVGDFQGGAANGFNVLLTKATDEVSDEELQNALEQDEQTIKSNQEVEIPMSTMTEEQVQAAVTKALEAKDADYAAAIQKALAEKDAEQKDAIEKAVKGAEEALLAKHATQDAELQVLKALEDSRKEAKFTEIAKSHMSVLGEAVTEADLMKALKEADGVETLATLTKALEAYAHIVKNADKLVEVGKSTLREQTSESKADIAVAKYAEENKVSIAKATEALATSNPELFTEYFA